MNKKLPLILVLFLLIKGTLIGASPDQSVIAAARQHVSHFLERIPAGQESLYGFKSRDEFRMVVIGNPYRMAKLNDNFYAEKKPTGNSYITASDEWRVPVSVNGEDRTLLTVIKTADSYQVVDFGGVQLAKELQEFRTAHPGNPGNFLLRVYSYPMDFFVTCSGPESLNRSVVYPMVLTKNLDPSMQRLQKESLTVQEALSFIKEQITNHQ